MKLNFIWYQEMNNYCNGNINKNENLSNDFELLKPNIVEKYLFGRSFKKDTF